MILWISLAIAIYNAIRLDPTLPRTWRGAALVLLIAGFLVCYEAYERSEARRGGHWPVPYRRVLLYLILQLTFIAILLHATPSFMGAGFALMGQVFSSLPMRKWPIPIGAIIAITSVPIGLAEAISQSDWGSLLGYLFLISSWIAIAIFISILFHERHQRERLIAELRQTKDELERYALQAEELAALRERTRLAREMHDSLGHALVLVNVKLEVAERLYAVDTPRGNAELEATRALIRGTLAELRRSLANLRTELPIHQNLPLALQRTADEIRARTNLAITCSAPPDLPPLASPASEALWHVAREALTNIERHAGAASALVALERSNGAVALRVIDDGSGVAADDLARPGHYGIIGMRERIEALGGTLRVAAQPGGGTIVEAHVPAGIEN
jgi:signal transduction histidine kinase